MGEKDDLEAAADELRRTGTALTEIEPSTQFGQVDATLRDLGLALIRVADRMMPKSDQTQ